MRRLALGCTLPLLLACGGGGDEAADTALATTPPAAAPAPSGVATADRAGTWEGRSMEGDSVVSTWRMVTTGDTNGWTLTFPEGEAIPVRVLGGAGDSVHVEFGPYASPRLGQEVVVESWGRWESRDRQSGTYVARLASNRDSVSAGRWEATRAP